MLFLLFEHWSICCDPLAKQCTEALGKVHMVPTSDPSVPCCLLYDKAASYCLCYHSPIQPCPFSCCMIYKKICWVVTQKELSPQVSVPAFSEFNWNGLLPDKWNLHNQIKDQMLWWEWKKSTWTVFKQAENLILPSSIPKSAKMIIVCESWSKSNPLTSRAEATTHLSTACTSGSRSTCESCIQLC